MSLLEYLRARSQVSSDTLDVDVVSKLGPFIDNTSNQAIAYGELSKPKHVHLLQSSASLAKRLEGKFEDVDIRQLSVEIAMVKLSLLLKPHITGYVHVQVNPCDSYSTAMMVQGGRRIVSLFKELAPEDSSSRVCIKIPSTWEGLQACRILEEKGIATLATTLFSLEQAAVAGQAGCTYIAPYVNELKVHFEPGYRDMSPNFELCVQAQKLFTERKIKTKVLAASLTSVKECVQLAGIDNITIAPALLEELDSTAQDIMSDGKDGYASFFDKTSTETTEQQSLLDLDEERFRFEFTRRNGGREEAKLIQAINIFCDIQLKLEDLVSTLL